MEEEIEKVEYNTLFKINFQLSEGEKANNRIDKTRGELASIKVFVDNNE